MDTFNFPYHVVKTQYPNSADSMQFGNSYVFTAKPRAPDQRLFILTFPGMKFFFNDDGTFNTATNATWNYKTFRNFYEAHGTWDTFIYPHPEFGNLNVKFAQPLADPDPIVGGNGAQGQFEIQLREQP